MGSEFISHLRETIREWKEKEATDAAKAAMKEGDAVAASHHAARANALHDSWRNPEAQREVDEEAVSQLRASLSHPDPAVRNSARAGLQDFGIMFQ